MRSESVSLYLGEQFLHFEGCLHPFSANCLQILHISLGSVFFVTFSFVGLVQGSQNETAYERGRRLGGAREVPAPERHRLQANGLTRQSEVLPFLSGESQLCPVARVKHDLLVAFWFN